MRCCFQVMAPIFEMNFFDTTVRQTLKEAYSGIGLRRGSSSIPVARHATSAILSAPCVGLLQWRLL